MTIEMKTSRAPLLFKLTEGEGARAMGQSSVSFIATSRKGIVVQAGRRALGISRTSLTSRPTEL
jgi:hypothetical protein